MVRGVKSSEIERMTILYGGKVRATRNFTNMWSDSKEVGQVLLMVFILCCRRFMC
jgi:hypothetical protein